MYSMSDFYGSSVLDAGKSPHNMESSENLKVEPPKSETVQKPFIAWSVLIASLILVRFLWEMAE